jgi:PAS domain S-box-containing protein
MTENPPVSNTSLEVPTVGLLAGLAHLHQTVLVVDQSDRVVWISDTLRELCGRESLVGQSARVLFNRDDCHDAIRRRMMQQGYVANEPIALVHEDGREIPVELSIGPVPNSCGSGLYLAVVRGEGDAADETSIPVPEMGYFRSILDSASDAVVALDRSGYVTYANPALKRVLGLPSERLLGLPVSLAFSRRGALDGLAEALRPGRDGQGVELEVTRKGGGTRILSVTASPIQLPSGTCGGTVAFLRDVTDQRRSETDLALKNQELEHYVHAVSHDLRTPLVSLLGFSRLLAQDYGDVLTDTGRHFLDRIEQASRSMETLINDLLELSRIGTANGQRDWVDPLPVLKQLANELKPRLEAQGIELALPSSPPVALCVRTQFYQISSNLIGNAIEHMGERDGARIEVAADGTQDGVRLRVKDNGVGIRPEEQARVFEVFHTGVRRPGARRGTGIGLAIVKKIAEAHGGRVWLESEPGEGASFSVLLPGA